MTLDEQKAVNTIINCAASKGIRTFIDITQNQNHKNGTYYPQVQIDLKGKGITDLAFFFGVDNGEKLNYSSIFSIEEDDLDVAYKLKSQFPHWKQKAFQYFIVDGDGNCTIHLYSEMDPRDFTPELFDEIIRFLRSEEVGQITEIAC